MGSEMCIRDRSRYQVASLLALRGRALTTNTSPDLGMTSVEIRLCDDGVIFPGGEIIHWDDLAQIAASDGS